MGKNNHLTAETLSSARILWNYLKMDQPLQKSDVVIAMGSHDLRTAECAAQLVLDEWAPLLICSGGLGRLTSGVWQQTEADQFAAVASEKGLPPEKIFKEDRSTNTGENLMFSKALCEEKEITFKNILLVHKPYMERRVWAAARKLWTDLNITVSSPAIEFEAYPTKAIPLKMVIQIMVGDFQRILVYPKKGFAVSQTVPDPVMQAFDKLVNSGFTHQLI
ncbi:MAG: YdcF family protein [Pelolinea sp.]|nr:YdcF family protein [Pelolinea sp.]